MSQLYTHYPPLPALALLRRHFYRNQLEVTLGNIFPDTSAERWAV
jgi:hypothetical protein